MKIGLIPFLNVAPFYHGWNGSFVTAAPRALGLMARKEEIDAAPLPVFDTFFLEDRFEPVGDFGLAVKEKVMSVILFTKKPLESLSGSVVSVTEESSTSVALLRLLLAERFHLQGVEFAREGDASLLIGDRALAEYTSCGWPFSFDLASLWHEWTGLPFVFARWVMRRSLSSEEKAPLAETLSKNLGQAMEEIEKIAREGAERLGISERKTLHYLKNFIYRLGPEEEKGLALFREMLRKAGQIP